MAESFGIIQAAQRARAWGPRLETDGQRLVLAGLVFHMGADSTADPSIYGRNGEPGQLPEWANRSDRSCSRILGELVELGVIAPQIERSQGKKSTRWIVLNPDTQMTGINPDTQMTGKENPTLSREASTLSWEASNPVTQMTGPESEISEKKGAYVVADAQGDSSSGAIEEEEDCEGHNDDETPCLACLRQRFPKLAGEKLSDYMTRIDELAARERAGLAAHG